MIWLALVIGLSIWLVLRLTERYDSGPVGRALRDSTHAAWRDEVEHREGELELLRHAEPRRGR